MWSGVIHYAVYCVMSRILSIASGTVGRCFHTAAACLLPSVQKCTHGYQSGPVGPKLFCRPCPHLTVVPVLSIPVLFADSVATAECRCCRHGDRQSVLPWMQSCIRGVHGSTKWPLIEPLLAIILHSSMHRPPFGSWLLLSCSFWNF